MRYYCAHRLLLLLLTLLLLLLFAGALQTNGNLALVAAGAAATTTIVGSLLNVAPAVRSVPLCDISTDRASRQDNGHIQ